MPRKTGSNMTVPLIKSLLREGHQRDTEYDDIISKLNQRNEITTVIHISPGKKVNKFTEEITSGYAYFK